MISRVWLNGEFHTKPWTQMVPEATQSPPGMRSLSLSQNFLTPYQRGHSPAVTQPLGLTVYETS